jgi:hypothetical protein
MVGYVVVCSGRLPMTGRVPRDESTIRDNVAVANPAVVHPLNLPITLPWALCQPAAPCQIRWRLYHGHFTLTHASIGVCPHGNAV